MSEESSWNPVSGCFPCPINIDLDQAWGGINPLPCFHDLRRSYFSVPLKALYMPLLFLDSFYFDSGYFASSGVYGEVDNDKVGKFNAMGLHEKWHSDMYVFGIKGCIRLAANRAYQAVSDIIFTNSAEAWEHLQYWNSVILTLTKSVAFVEELIVTLLGCADFRDLDAKLSHKVEADRIEAEFVQAQAETFGSDFTKIYSQLDAIYRKFGIEPIVNLATYSIDWLEVEGVGTEAQVAFPMNYEETSKARLYQCLEIVNSIRQLPEAHHWTKGDWYQFFDRSLVNFRRLWSGRHELARFCESNIAQSREWWNDRGFEGTENPAVAAERIHREPQELAATVLASVIPADTADAQEQQRRQGLNEHLRLVHEQNRSLVCLGSPPNTISIIFVPLFDKDNQTAMPFTCVTTGTKPLLSLEERSVYERTLRESLETLLFFEGLRMMVATGYGVRCSVRCMEWAERALARIEGDRPPTCCGANLGIMAFWEAGNIAKEEGWFQPLSWECPYECLGTHIATLLKHAPLTDLPLGNEATH